jgi:hypothetical protein
LLFIVDATGVEPFEMPPDLHTWIAIFTNAVLDTVFNALLVLGISNSSVSNATN